MARSVAMADFEEKDFAESDPRQYSASSEYKNLVKGVAGLIVIGLSIWLGWLGWGYLNRIGWIAQTRTIDVHISGDWLTGEYRACQTDGRAEVLFCPSSGETLTPLVAAGQTPPRSFSVSFYGKITGKPGDTLTWKWKRKTESISCNNVQ